MEFDYNKLKSRIRARGYTYTAFAKELKISTNSLCLRLKNKQLFRVDEIMKAKELLDLENVDNYFFVKRA